MKIKRDSNLDNLSSLENNIAKLYRTNIIQPLKGFCRVVEEGNLSRAAEKYGVTPGLLTKQIKVIENQLGIELFNRDNNCRIFPNEAGLEFYKEASEIINQLDNLIIRFSKYINEKNEKKLMIGTNSFMLNKVTLTASAYKNIDNETELSIDIFEQSNGIKALLDNKIDIFISSKETSESVKPGIRFTKLSDYVPYWILWKGHPLENKDELTRDDLIAQKMCFSYDDITMPSLKLFIKDNLIKSYIKFSKCNVDTYKSLIKNKLGIWLIFNVFLEQEDKNYFTFKKATNLFPTGEYGCYTKNCCHENVNKFVEFLKEDKLKIFNDSFLLSK